MRRPQRIASARERLDDAGHDPRVLESSLDDVARVNRFLGGRRAVRLALKDLGHTGAELRILDAGTASADIPIALATRRSGRSARLRITAIEPHPQALDIARRRTAAVPAIQLVSADVRALPFPEDAFDVALLSMTLHHLDDDDQTAALRELGRVAPAVIVNELERCWPNYLGARLLAATAWRSNPLTRHDGPLSVLRAFTAAELRTRARAAGLRPVRIQHRWFHRLVMTATRASDPMPKLARDWHRTPS
jgi:SAM-dependent methyltransferase